MRRAYPKSKGQLHLNFQSAAAKEEAGERQTAARETLIHEPVVEVIETWLNRPFSASVVAVGDALVDEFEGEVGDEMFVRC